MASEIFFSVYYSFRCKEEVADVISFGFVSTRLCQTRFFRIFSPFWCERKYTNQKKMNNGSKYYSTVCDSREKASISFLHKIPVDCAYEKEETSIIIEMGFLL